MSEVEKIIKRVKQNEVVWRGHALQRMLERNISREDVKIVLQDGKIIEEYPDDFPFPSFLVMGYSKGRVLHVVCSISEDALWIITAYKPDPDIWESDFQARRS